MLDQNEITLNTIALLSCTDLADVSQAVCDLVKRITNSPVVALYFWDADLEILTNAYLLGEQNNYRIFLGKFVEQFEYSQDLLYLIDTDQNEMLSGNQTFYCYEIMHNKQLQACLLFHNNNGNTKEELLNLLQIYPLSLILHRSWQNNELARENQRLRASYEEMENKTRMLEEQTRKLIQDLTMKDVIRTKHVERERLIYSISNVVRSYVDIQKVLETTVEKIGEAFAVSRCLLIHHPGGQSSTDMPLQVFEFTKDTPSIKDLFNSKEGRNFIQTSFALTRAQELNEPFKEINYGVHATFLSKLLFRSGLIIPLLLREHTLGLLFLQDCIHYRPWSIDDISLIESLADQISVAIENAELHLEQEKQAITDGLTNIANRRSFSKTILREFERAKRYEQPLSLIVLDLDYLKVINDNFGHQVGDEAIKAIANVLKQSSRAIDLAARYGGEEFCLLLPNTELTMAEQLAERLKKLIADIHLEGPGHISASLGIANYPIHAHDADSLFRAADVALYEAKQSGRNRVKVAKL